MNKRKLVIAAGVVTVILAAVALLRTRPVSARIAALIDPTSDDYFKDVAVLREEAVDLTDAEISQLLALVKRDPEGWLGGRVGRIKRVVAEWTGDGSPTRMVLSPEERMQLRRAAAFDLLAGASKHAGRVLPVLDALAAGSAALNRPALPAAAMLRASAEPRIPADELRGRLSYDSYPLYMAVTAVDPPRADLLPLLLGRLTNRTDLDLVWIARGLARYGPAASNALPVLRAKMREGNKYLQPDATLAVGMISRTDAEEAVISMVGQARTNAAYASLVAGELYRGLGPVAAAAVPSLERQLAATNISIFTVEAAQSLWAIRHEATPAMVAALTSGLELGRAESRRRSFQALREIGPAASTAIPVLERLTHSRWRQFRRLATETLEAVRGRETGK
jgi:hypothetical protein